MRRVLGPSHRSTLNTMIVLALIHDDEGEFVEAEVILREVLEIRTIVYGLDDMNTPVCKISP